MLVAVLALVVISLSIFKLILLNLRRNGVKVIPSVNSWWSVLGGQFHMDASRCHMSFAGLSTSYGPVFRVWQLDGSIVVLNNYATIHEALVQKAAIFAGRPKIYRTRHFQRDKNSIVWQTNTPKLKFLRKQVLKSLKMYGQQLERLEERCAVDIDELSAEISKFSGTAFDPYELIYDSVCNVMLSYVIGNRFKYGSNELTELKRVTNLFNASFSSGDERRIDSLPWLRFWFNKEYIQLKEAVESRDEYWATLLQDHKISKESVIGQLMEARETDGKELDINDETLKECFTNLMLAGTDTTATAIVCLLLLLLHNPNIKQKIHNEIDSNVPQDSMPLLIHRQHMPYVEAVLLELLRYISHVPLAIPHSNTEATIIDGYYLPKDSKVYINLWALHHDPDLWSQPWKFDPSRFLDQAGQLVTPQHPNRKRLFVFSAGRRVCLGETLAKNRLFLYIVTLLQRFDFLPDDSLPLPSIDPRNFTSGIVLHPSSFKLRAKQRS